MIDYLWFYVPLKNFSLILRRHHCWWRAAKFKPMLGAQGLWAGRDLYRATPTVIRGLVFFPVSSEGPPHFVASDDAQGGVEDLFLLSMMFYNVIHLFTQEYLWSSSVKDQLETVYNCSKGSAFWYRIYDSFQHRGRKKWFGGIFSNKMILRLNNRFALQVVVIALLQI
jgi:hypothetical protein